MKAYPSFLYSLIIPALTLLLTGCISTGTLDAPAADNPAALTEGIITSSLTDNAAIANDRPRHILYTPDTATPWWAVVAHLEAEYPDGTKPWPDALTPDERFGPPSGLHKLYQNAHKSPGAPVFPATPDIQDDLWQRLRGGFKLTGQNHRFVNPYIDWYTNNQAYLDRVVERARPFLYDIVKEIEARGMPMEIALLPVVESAFQPFAYSAGRAAGIWQFIPATGKRYGLKQNWWYDGRRDVPEATTAALNYLSRLHKRFDGDWLLALASYNSGEGRVTQAIRLNKKKGRPTDFWSLDLPEETQGYVPKLLAIATVVGSPEQYDVNLVSIPDEPYLERVDIGSQIDLALAAELAEMPIETMYKLNPAYNRWATDPNGPHSLSLPIDKAEGFQQALSKVDKKDRIRWERHRIRKGENLGQIALKFQTTVELLQDVNNIRDKWIRAGESIIIPVATKNLKHYLSEDQRRLSLQNTNRSGFKVRHTVQPGDTFWDISRKFKVEVGQIASWNGMSPRDSLMPGQVLVIWARDRNLASERYAAPPRSATRQQLHYTVRKGDSLALIADKFSVTVNKLRKWNLLPKGKYLQPGQRLMLYVDVTQQS